MWRNTFYCQRFILLAYKGGPKKKKCKLLENKRALIRKCSLSPFVLFIGPLQEPVNWSVYYFSLPKDSLKELQHVQNVAARIATNSRKSVRITLILCKVHWLLTEERIVFKILLLTFKCLNGLAPPYLCDLTTKYMPRRNLRSINDHRLVDGLQTLIEYDHLGDWGPEKDWLQLGSLSMQRF